MDVQALRAEWPHPWGSLICALENRLGNPADTRERAYGRGSESDFGQLGSDGCSNPLSRHHENVAKKFQTIGKISRPPAPVWNSGTAPTPTKYGSFAVLRAGDMPSLPPSVER